MTWHLFFKVVPTVYHKNKFMLLTIDGVVADKKLFDHKWQAVASAKRKTKRINDLAEKTLTS